MRAVSGVRGRVTFGVLAVAAILFSALGGFGFVRVADSGRAAIRDRVGDVLDQLETAVRGGAGTLSVSSADGVSAVVLESPDPVSPPTPDNRSVVTATRVIMVDGHRLTLLGTASPARLDDTLRSLYRTLWIAIPFASILTAVLAGFATGRALAPVDQIIGFVETVGDDASGRRILVPETGDEIERLASTMNSMLDRLDAGRQAQQRFTADAAHELRTPLMALRGELDLLPAGADPDDRLSSLVRRLGARIDDLVLLSTLDERRPLSFLPVALHDLSLDEAAIISPDIAIHGPETVVLGDRALLARAIRNLLANAHRHANLQVSLIIETDEERVWLHVDDDGRGIEQSQAARIFERFSRLDEARSVDTGGSGLGLAIVASVAAAHGGGTAAGASALSGARVSMWLPLRGAVDVANEGPAQWA